MRGRLELCVCVSIAWFFPPRASLELQLRHRIAEQRMQFEALSIRNREKEKEMK